MASSPRVSSVRVAYAILSQYASFSRFGHVNISDGDVDSINGDFPGRIVVPLYLVTKWLFAPADCGRVRRLRYELTDEAGAVLWQAEQDMEPPPPEPPYPHVKYIAITQMVGIDI